MALLPAFGVYVGVPQSGASGGAPTRACGGEERNVALLGLRFLFYRDAHAYLRDREA